MFSKFKSTLKKIYLIFDFVYDNAYRVIAGMPQVKRSQITARLYLGGQYNRLGLKKLKALGITAIVNIRTHNVYGEAAHFGIKYLHLSTIDNTPPSIDALIRGADFIDQEIQQNGKVYVHCRQGLGRGPTMAIANLLKTGLTYQDAYDLIRKVRVFINPRQSQINRLKELEKYYKAHR